MRRYGLIFLLLLFLLPALWSLFQPGFFVSDDGEWMIIRLTAFHQTLATGQFPVRFAFRLNHGYGYPIFNFAYPGGFYLGEVFHLLGFNFVSSVKLVFGLSLILAGVFSFLWLRKRFSLTASFLGSLVYVYSPYLLWDVYKRGSMGEVLALGLVPFFLWAIEKKDWLSAGLAYGLLIVSHNVLALLLTPVLILYSWLSACSWRRIAVILFLGLGLSAFFWLPALKEASLTVLSQTVVGNPFDHFVKNISLIGTVNLAFFLLAFFLFLKKKDKLVGFFLVCFFLGVFLASQFSIFFWQFFPWPFLIQYPFRFLSLTLPAVAFLAAFVFHCFFKKKAILWLGLILIVLFFFSWPFTKPAGFFQKDEGFYLTNEHSTAIHNEYLPLWVEEIPLERPEEKVEVIEGKAEISFQDQLRRIEFQSQSEEPIKVRVNVLYYPGWQVWVDSEKAAFSFKNQRGVIEIPLQAGEHQVEVKFSEIPFRQLANFVSLGTIFFLLGVFIKKRKKK